MRETGDYQPSLVALAVGLPVVTMPSPTHIGGRFTLALYQMLGYGYQKQHPKAAKKGGINEFIEYPHPLKPMEDKDLKDGFNSQDPHANDGVNETVIEDDDALYTPLVVSTVQEYVTLAIRLTHQPKLRQYHSERILSRRHRLFQQDPAAVLAQWRLFAQLALQNSTHHDSDDNPKVVEDARIMSAEQQEEQEKRRKLRDILLDFPVTSGGSGESGSTTKRTAD